MMTVGDLRRTLEGLDDGIEVVLEGYSIVLVGAGSEGSEPLSTTEWFQVSLREAKVEARCAEVDTLFLFGDEEEDLLELDRKEWSK